MAERSKRAPKAAELATESETDAESGAIWKGMACGQNKYISDDDASKPTV